MQKDIELLECGLITTRGALMKRLVEAGREAFGEERLDAALDYWRRALLIDPENERIQAYIARAERQLESLERLRDTPRSESTP